jgi:hypothetical protein
MENKTTRLSHSAVTRYQTCPKSFDYHYNHGLRTVTTTGALLFGSAVDAGLTALVGSGTKSAESCFMDAWTNSSINDVSVYLPTCTRVVYSDSDADKDLLTPDAYKTLAETYGADWEEILNKIIQKKKMIGFKYIKKEEKELLNHYNWLCLSYKGLLMIDAVRKQILPKIEKVLGTQVEVKLENSQGDKIIGFADLIAKYKGIDKPVVFDWKTSSIDYDEDSVLISPQLSLYVHALSEQFENTRHAGFIVLHKRIIKNKKKVCKTCGYDGTGARHKTCSATINEKRCDGEWVETLSPEVKIQVITNEIPEQTEQIIIENIDQINIAIKTGNFIRNLNSCKRPWGICEFHSKCFKGSDEGLIKK